MHPDDLIAALEQFCPGPDWAAWIEPRAAAGMDPREALRDHPTYWALFPTLGPGPHWREWDEFRDDY
jgi:hypothetical protein